MFILTPQHDLLLYSLSIKKTNSNNKVMLVMKLHYEVNIMMMNEISSFPLSFQMSKREFTHFEAQESKNFICFVLADSMGNI